MYVSLTCERVKRDGSYLLIVREESQLVLKLQPVSQRNQRVEKNEGFMNSNKVYETTLYLDNIEHLFSKPDLSPLSDHYREYSHTSGIEYLAKELYAQPTIEEVRVNIVLPLDKIMPDLEQKTKAAVLRYCRGRVKALEQETQGLRKRAIEATLMAIVGLVIFISVGSILTYSTSFEIEVIGQGLTVLGWVFVWFPLDSFIFGVRHYCLDKRIYEKLVHMQLTIKSSS